MGIHHRGSKDTYLFAQGIQGHIRYTTMPTQSLIKATHPTENVFAMLVS